MHLYHEDIHGLGDIDNWFEEGQLLGSTCYDDPCCVNCYDECSTKYYRLDE